jgi:hypothetical protein
MRTTESADPAPKTATGTRPANGVALTWDYYKTIFSRNGIYNDGVGGRSR